MTSVFRKVAFFLSVPACLFCLPGSAAAQSTYTAQLTGVVTDSSGGVVVHARVTLTDEATGVAVNMLTDERGIYVFTGIRPAKYTLLVEASGFASQQRTDVILAVSQQATLDFKLSLGSFSSSVTVTEQAPLLDTGSATLGTDVTNEYVRDIPLINRSMFGLVFLAGGVTETTGSGTQDSYPSGTNFVSNGQRNATAEVRLDGALTSAPEQGEGGTTNVYYQPSVEIVQEFKVENNSFSAEYGNNGGTVVNMVLKEGGSQFHFVDSPGSAHLVALEKDFTAESEKMPKEFLAALSPSKEVLVIASPLVASNSALVNGRLHIFLMNFAGIIPHHNLRPSPASSVSIAVPSSRKCVLHFLPFLGNDQKITSKPAGDSQIFSLLLFDRGAVAWLEDTQ